MPRHWHDYHTVCKIENTEERRFQLSIVADKKPYFMRYIYGDLKKQYKDFINTTRKNALREFGLDIDQLKALPPEELTDRQRDFLRYYDKRMPVGVGDCVVNTICRKFEERFDGWLGQHNKATTFDYTVLRGDSQYPTRRKNEVRKLYMAFRDAQIAYRQYATYWWIDSDESKEGLASLFDTFQRQCQQVVSNDRVLCDIVLDICYQRTTSKAFAWTVSGEQIIENLLERNGWTLTYPTQDPDGEICYGGYRYTVATKKIGDAE